ncbi:hypothetical protein BOX15_Mlig031755g3 [Macrostomum lignano]|uniref:Carboxypeptidase n=3 Tax=Macrostomum lignano TaxID=282301 RepID=A0A1I8H396_9PLAT|nr:hypothetical protein BOX15_Mlig031755g3 [Macrostomum lignano]
MARLDSMLLPLLLAAVGSLTCHAAPAEDQVMILPGLKQQPAFKHYSGYLKAGGDRHLHYWLVESSKADPTKAPLVLWFNGGPGCSSLEGLLRENGPFRVNDMAWLEMNPYAWNRDANVLYIEAPAGVGFSYSESNVTKTNDTQVAEDNYLALKSFLEKFPEYKGREMHISGESYGGVYVPTLAARVLTDKSINLRGILIGNSIDSWPLNSLSLIYFGYYHGLIGYQFWANLTSSCCNSCVGVRCDFYAGKSKPACADLLSRAERITDGLNIYNLYQPCYGGVPKSRRQRSLLNNLMFDHLEDSTMDVTSWTMLMSQDDTQRDSSQQRQTQQESPSPQQVARTYLLRRSRQDRLASIGEDPPCTNSTAITTYLNLPAARYALHVKDVGPYTICSNLDYTVEYNDMTPVYQKLLKSGRLRITLYNGDVDMACNFLQTEWFLQNLNQTVTTPRKPWYFDDPVNGRQIGGFVRQWAGNLTYLTVRGSGHMVPEDKPQQAYVLFKNHLTGSGY